MTVSEIIEEARGIIQETDPANSHVTDAKLIEWINACTMQLCSTITTLPKATINTVVTAATLTLPEDLLRIDYVSMLLPNGRYECLSTVDFNNFVLTNKEWQNIPDDIPNKLVRMDNTTWMMYPSPSADYTGLEMTIIGTVLPAELSSTAQTPVLPKVLHPCYPHYLAWKAWLLINDPAKAQSEFQIYDSLRKINLKTATSTRGSLQSLKMEM